MMTHIMLGLDQAIRQELVRQAMGLVIHAKNLQRLQQQGSLKKDRSGIIVAVMF